MGSGAQEEPVPPEEAAPAPDPVPTPEDFVATILAQEASNEHPNLVRLSIALGALETAWTDKKGPVEAPAPLERHVADGEETFEGWALGTLAPRLADIRDVRARVKAIADAVWARLAAKSFAKDVLHAQHLSSLVDLLGPSPVPAAKRQLDCAGVVVAVLCVCQAIARHNPGSHGGDLAAVRMQVSEDHCWLTLDGSGTRRASCEVTTTSASQRACAVGEAEWRGWLYSGGCAPVLSIHQTLAALVVSADATVRPGKKGRPIRSERMQALQLRLLGALVRRWRPLCYPAVHLAHAALIQMALEDEVERAWNGDGGVALSAVRRAKDCWRLLDEALDRYAEWRIKRSVDPGQGAEFNGRPVPCGRVDDVELAEVAVYPWSLSTCVLAGQAEWSADSLSSEEQVMAGLAPRPPFEKAVRMLATTTAVLSQYGYSTRDEALHREVERAIESVCDAAQTMAERSPPETSLAFLSPDLLLLIMHVVQNLCAYYGARSKPGAHLARLLTVVKANSTADARRIAAWSCARSTPKSRNFEASLSLWTECSVRLLRQALEAPEPIQQGPDRKRQRRSS